jgi:ubiquinone biosynthesis accessory factor UbiK
MTSPKFSPSAAIDAINQFAGKFEQVLKNSPVSELEKNARQRVISQLAKHGLVTREEYEIQAAMLAKARAKLVELEAKLAALDTQLAQSKTKA